MIKYIKYYGCMIFSVLWILMALYAMYTKVELAYWFSIVISSMFWVKSYDYARQYFA